MCLLFVCLSFVVSDFIVPFTVYYSFSFVRLNVSLLCVVFYLLFCFVYVVVVCVFCVLLFLYI